MVQSDHDPIAKFIRWLEDTGRAKIPNYEAMALATTAGGGKTSVRFVLLKGIDERGFVFFTDTRSRKGRELHGNPFASLAFYWHPKGRQVRVEGRVEKVTPAEADAYWPTRPRQSRLAASVSHRCYLSRTDRHRFHSYKFQLLKWTIALMSIFDSFSLSKKLFPRVIVEIKG
jgi:pyridoxamine 5'-phosphate oxidase